MSAVELSFIVCTQEARRGIAWWKMGICKLKGVRTDFYTLRPPSRFCFNFWGGPPRRHPKSYWVAKCQQYKVKRRYNNMIAMRDSNANENDLLKNY
jgi:hypothetical protein